MYRHCLARFGEGVAAFADDVVADCWGAGSSRLGTAKYERPRLAPTNEEDNVIPAKVAARALGSEVAISGISSTTLRLDPLSQDRAPVENCTTDRCFESNYEG
jgi:hypothetical protein